MSSVLHGMSWAARILGLFVLGVGVLGLYECFAVWSWRWWLIAKIASFIVLAMISLLAIDNGLGLVLHKEEPVKLVVMDREPRAPNRLFVLVPGYNGNGYWLTRTLAPALTPYGDVVSFRPPYRWFDPQLISEALYRTVAERRAEQVIAYGESLGGMLVVDMLRDHPEIHLQRLVLNATPDRSSSVKLGGRALAVFNVLHGGPITTSLLRWKQRQDVADSPQLEPGVNPSVARAAESDSVKVTAPMAFGQLRYIADFRLPAEGEASRIARQVDVVMFLHAADDTDPLIKTQQAQAAWRRVFGYTLRDMPVGDWHGLHAPTTERPKSVKDALIGAVQG